MAVIDKHTLVCMHFDGNLKDECDNLAISDWVNHSNAGYENVKFGQGLSMVNGGQPIYRYISQNDFFDSLFKLNEYTIDFWCSNQQSYDIGFVLQNGYSTGSRGDYGLIISAGIFRFNGVDLYAENYNYATMNHIALSKNNNGYYFFVNGMLKKFVATTTTPTIKYGYAIIGFGFDGYPSYHTEPTRYDEFRISDIARWTSNFTPPTKPYTKSTILYLNSSKAYGVDSTNTFKELSSNWLSETPSNKLAILQSVEDEPSISDLATISPFKVVTLQEDTPTTNATVKAVPKTQLVTPKKLIKTSSFEHLNSVTIAGNTSGNGDIKVAVTTDLTTYYVWDKVNLAWTPITTSNIATGGMTIADVSALTTTEWDLLVGYDIGDGVAFAYSLDIDSTSDVAVVDQLTINVDMKGSWNKAVYGTDYTYGYQSNDTLKVKLLTDGDYKINYVQ